jgi:glycosyltransferase involved in cell wall biosynthesis
MVLLSVIMPAYNEGENLNAVHEEVVNVITANNWVKPFELIIVDDGSTDDTGKIADMLSDKESTTRVIHHTVNQGLGTALKTGFAASKGDFVSWISADGEINIQYILDLLRLSDDADMVVGGTRLREGVVAWYREVFSKTLGILSKMLLGFDWSQMSGLYLIRGVFLRELVFISSTGMVNFEVYIHALQHHLRIKTGPPLQARVRFGGKSKVTNLRTISKTFFDMVKLRFTLSKKKKYD